MSSDERSPNAAPHHNLFNEGHPEPVTAPLSSERSPNTTSPHQPFLVEGLPEPITTKQDPTPRTSSKAHPNRRRRKCIPTFAKIFGGILDWIIYIAVVHSARFVLPNLQTANCTRVWRYYLTMTLIPPLSLFLSALWAFLDKHPRMVIEKAFFLRLFYWPRLTVDDKPWSKLWLWRNIPGGLVHVSLLALTLVALNDTQVSEECLEIAKGGRYTLLKINAVGSGLHLISTIFT
ncbi:hypothetical protein HDV05_002430 [Chytridiales sp. JEL 0842]|nr:hypothetical protein HDV05_002430 [Chytridiales sp. JEL 0842]